MFALLKPFSNFIRSKIVHMSIPIVGSIEQSKQDKKIKLYIEEH